MTNYRKLGGLTNRHSFSPSSGGCRSEIKVSTGFLVRENRGSASAPGSGGLTAILVAPWRVEASP